MPRPPPVGSWADPTPPHPRHGDEIAVAGEFLHTHVSNKVIQWFDPGGFDAYDPTPPLPADVAPGASPALAAERGGALVPVPRHGTRRIGGPNGELVTSAADLERALTQLVVHYDGCGRSRDCFRVLHDERGLSCHFLIDVDGRVYQTLDVIERAWHATSANDSSVGVELAHEGAFVEGEAPFDESSPKIFRGDVNGRSLAQRPFTDAQYESLARVAATLIARFPLMTADYPTEDAERGTNAACASSNFGAATPRKLSDGELRDHRGVLGHYHVQSDKSDPGPAFDWGRFRSRTLALLDGAGETERAKRVADRVADFRDRFDGAAALDPEIRHHTQASVAPPTRAEAFAAPSAAEAERKAIAEATERARRLRETQSGTGSVA